MNCKFPYCNIKTNENNFYCSDRHRKLIHYIKKSIRDGKYFEYFRQPKIVQKAYFKLKNTYKIKWK